jgi:phosphoribosyl 1,2-cyclic phosphate phosphodiesterase
MQKKGNLIFLGTGASSGVPMIGCTCPRCLSADPKNQRLRPSVLVTINGKRLLIDTSPDLRQQALKNGLTRLDGVLLTHTHYDHIAGIDELRVFYLLNKSPLPVLLSEETHDALKERYSYLFKEKCKSRSLPAQLDFHLLKGKEGKADFLDLEIGYLSYEQGGMKVTGYRFGNMAYVSDLSKYDESIFKELAGVKILILSALKQETSYMHLSIDQAVEFSKRVGATTTYLMHLSHDVDYEETSQTLPQGVLLAYDGLNIEFDY